MIAARVAASNPSGGAHTPSRTKLRLQDTTDNNCCESMLIPTPCPLHLRSKPSREIREVGTISLVS
jgi:hypothetical protein